MVAYGILGIGDNVMDAYLNKGIAYPGGNSVNVPVLARRYDPTLRTGYIGILGNDGPGQHFKAALESEGLDLSRLRVAVAPTACNHIHIDETGERDFVGNNGEDVAELMLQLVLTPADMDTIATYGLAHTSVHSFIQPLHAAISRRAPLSLDFSDGHTPRNVREIAPLLRYAFFSGKGYDEDGVRALACHAYTHGAKTVVVTMGERGAYLLDETGEYRQPCQPVEAVDTLGVGDAYIAAFLVEALRGASLRPAADRAAEFAAKNCMQPSAFGHPYKL